MDEEKMFLEIYDKYGEQVMRHISFRVSNNKEAQDIFQETFLRTWKSLVNEQKIENLRAFVYMVARNLIIDFYRKKSRSDIALDDLGANEPSSNDLADSTSDKIEVKKIKAAIESLETDNEREIVYMRYIDDLSVKEIATMMDKNPNNIRVICHRGLKKIRNQLYV
ncbi:RNA polymerase sigma factor [Candidatus Parcubacteria bacterium]|nr:RNA polymerase sigma factor [Patescibacteria group bacterium]MBU4309116.1 RNA polymerase sigma factor [Patescibacteria group bacterium]MBU4432712.1 RNA polymerase sigma factor [Patescibacteria group bacterium]MBU4577477.1 RNA polymerase sigma factor [Patescibacteria group bacterium]MCG2697165.1 RNA polymerase sigma factor [Candidatus Parcubacteria bacterium]